MANMGRVKGFGGAVLVFSRGTPVTSWMSRRWQRQWCQATWGSFEGVGMVGALKDPFWISMHTGACGPYFFSAVESGARDCVHTDHRLLNWPQRKEGPAGYLFQTGQRRSSEGILAPFTYLFLIF